MDKNFRILGKVSIVDILLVVLLVAGLFVLQEFAAPRSVNAGPNDVKIEYTVELYRKDRGFSENVQIGEILYDSEKGYEIGTIVDVYEIPYREDSPDFENKVFKRADVEGISNVYVVVEAMAQITDASTNVGQYQVMVGKEAFVKSRSFAAGGYFVKIERLS